MREVSLCEAVGVVVTAARPGQPDIPDEWVDTVAKAVFGGADDVWAKNPGNVQAPYRHTAERVLAALCPLVETEYQVFDLTARQWLPMSNFEWSLPNAREHGLSVRRRSVGPWQFHA